MFFSFVGRDPLKVGFSEVDAGEGVRGCCNVASPNINSGRRLRWTRHPHVHLAAAAQPLFDPRGIEHRRPEDERGEML
ncbi:hypothetical protein TNCV_1076561 [Trichonephila clavipes]|uniref:Uncharacterized protein n=1 Tax=Trichonephila clavipes TaxID=2585209 RepID=A0A8X6RN78_TRICX|nr:hypothetical protein TNCV_1076561 [Trichonephila clavipes]